MLNGYQRPDINAAEATVLGIAADLIAREVRSVIRAHLTTYPSSLLPDRRVSNLTSVAAVKGMAVRCVTAQLRCSVHRYFIGAFAAERGVKRHDRRTDRERSHFFTTIQMQTSTVVLLVVLFSATVLRRANTYMQGTKTAEISALLSLFILGCFIPPAISRQWILFICLPVVWAVVIFPIAGYLGVRLAVWINRKHEAGPFEKWVGIPNRRFTQLLEQKNAASERGISDISTFLESSRQRKDFHDAAMGLALSQPHIQSVLREFGASQDSVDRAFSQLIGAGIGRVEMGHHLPEAVAYYAHPLRVVLAAQAGLVEVDQTHLAIALIKYFNCGRKLPNVSGTA